MWMVFDPAKSRAFQFGPIVEDQQIDSYTPENYIYNTLNPKSWRFGSDDFPFQLGDF